MEPLTDSVAPPPAVTKAPPPSCDRVAWLFLRGMGLIYLCAFASFCVQAMGLIGSDGILPLSDWVDSIPDTIGARRYWAVPMVFWLNQSDFAIEFVCWAGVGFSLLLTCNILPRLSLLLLYVLYLSLIYAGQDFMTFQWDMFLVEAGFASLLMCFALTPGLWLLRWLLFRFMFLSGSVKLLSGDPTWASLTALNYHFLTQPLPTPLAWYVAKLPAGALAFGTGATFFIELVLPFLIFAPRRLRFAAAAGITLLEFCISLTGNYNFFNLQTMLLCVLLLDDAALAMLLPRRWLDAMSRRVRANNPRKPLLYAVKALVGCMMFISLVQMYYMFGGTPPSFTVQLERAIAPLRIVNTYGLFAVMTTKRNEIVIEGSDDAVTWKEYAFKYKPGDLTRPPLWNIPHQPRLDWQMWFAALEPSDEVPWFPAFLKKLLQNAPSVVALLEKNPFPDKPPRFIRAQFYAYTYSGPEEKAKGIWWRRSLLGTYFPMVSLQQ